MNKYLIKVIGLATILLLTACGGLKLSPKQQAMFNNQSYVYTQVPMWEYKKTVSGTNYKVGNLIKINSKVKLLKINAKSIIFEYDGTVIKFLIMTKYTKINAIKTLERIFGIKPVDLSKYGMDIVANIANGTLSNGMTKEEVVLARGYPPFHKTKSLQEDTWKYWNSRFSSINVEFKGGKLINVPDSLAPVNTIAVKDIYKNNYGQKLPYNFITNTKSQPDSFALVVGINKYQQNTAVEYADKSAMAFAELANKTFGIPTENIITLTNEQATSGQIKSKIELIKELADSSGNLYIYFAGHGVPGKDGSAYLLPYDMSADAIHLEKNLKLKNIYASLSKIKVKKIFFFIDSCFSGKDDNGRLLYRGVAPVLRTKKTIINSHKMTILTAGQSTDFANDFKAHEQRMFSYYLIKELSKGETNLNKIYPYIKRKVKRSSLLKGLGYKQIPQIYGNINQKLY